MRTAPPPPAAAAAAAAAAAGGGVVGTDQAQEMLFRLNYAETTNLRVGASIEVVTEDAPLSGDVGVENFFHVTDAYDVSFTLASLMKRRPNAYRCKLERTEYGIDVVDSHAHREEYHGYDGNDGWTEAAALGFGRIELVGGRVDSATGIVDPISLTH